MKEKKLKDMTALITGGGTGIGRVFARAFAEEGANVVICGRTMSALEKVSKEISTLGAGAKAVKADVTIEQDVENVVAQAIKAFGRVDILVNNAGTPGPQGLITDISKKVWDEVMAVNLTAAFLCSKAVLKHMIKQKKGNIINMSSGAGRLESHLVRSIPYSISKFGIEGLTHTLALQMKPYGICVNALRPGIVDTAFHKDSPAEFRSKLIPPDRVKGVVVFLASQTADTMTGQSIELAEWEEDQNKSLE